MRRRTFPDFGPANSDQRNNRTNIASSTSSGHVPTTGGGNRGTYDASRASTYESIPQQRQAWATTTETTSAHVIPQQQQLSVAEFRNLLFEKFKNSGTLDSLKSQLRAKLLSEIHNSFTNGGEPIIDFSANNKKTKSLRERALDGIVADYLKASGYNYSLAVFVPEANVSKETKLSTHNELLHMGGVVGSTTSRMRIAPVFGNNNSNSNSNEFNGNTTGAQDTAETQRRSLLYKMVEFIVEYANCVTIDASTQTQNQSPETTLDEKLRRVDDEFIVRVEGELLQPTPSLEERMLRYQKECDKRAREEIEAELKRYKELELSRMRLEESAKHREQLAELRAELEKSYSYRLGKLSQMEQELSERFQKKEQDFERYAQDTQNKLLVEAEKIRLSSLKLQEQKDELMRRSVHLDEKAKRLDSLASQCSADLRAEMAMLKAEFERKHRELNEAVQAERDELNAEKLQLARIQERYGEYVNLKENMLQLQDTLQSVHKQLKETRARNRQLETLVDELRQQLEHATTAANNKEAIDKIAQLQSELHNLQQERAQLEDSMSKQLANEKRIQQSEREKLLRVHAAELGSMRDTMKREILKEKAAARQYLQQVHAQFNAEKASLKQELQDKAEAAELAHRKLEDERLRVRTLENEIIGLRQLLKQTQQALESALLTRTDELPLASSLRALSASVGANATTAQAGTTVPSIATMATADTLYEHLFRTYPLPQQQQSQCTGSAAIVVEPRSTVEETLKLTTRTVDELDREQQDLLGLYRYHRVTVQSQCPQLQRQLRTSIQEISSSASSDEVPPPKTTLDAICLEKQKPASANDNYSAEDSDSTKSTDATEHVRREEEAARLLRAQKEAEERQEAERRTKLEEDEKQHQALLQQQRQQEAEAERLLQQQQEEEEARKEKERQEALHRQREEEAQIEQQRQRQREEAEAEERRRKMAAEEKEAQEAARRQKEQEEEEERQRRIRQKEQEAAAEEAERQRKQRLQEEEEELRRQEQERGREEEEEAKRRKQQQEEKEEEEEEEERRRREQQQRQRQAELELELDESAIEVVQEYISEEEQEQEKAEAEEVARQTEQPNNNVNNDNGVKDEYELKLEEYMRSAREKRQKEEEERQRQQREQQQQQQHSARGSGGYSSDGYNSSSGAVESDFYASSLNGDEGRSGASRENSDNDADYFGWDD